MSAPVRIDLSFTLEQDGFVLEVDHHADSRVLALFGPSGSGKTTCLEVIAGLRVPSRGRIAIAGRELYSSRGRLNLPPRLRGVSRSWKRGRCSTAACRDSRAGNGSGSRSRAR